MKNIQSLTLMMAVMVYAAPTTPSPKVLLTAIIDTVNILLHNKSLKELNFKVHAVTPGNGSTCTTEFFCLAEKSLKTSPQIKKAKLTGTVATNVDTLIRELRVYNNLTNINCSLDTAWGRRPMNKFLADIALCSSKKSTQHNMDELLGVICDM